MPTKVQLEAHEVEAVNRVRIAQYLGKFPHEVDEMPYQDYLDILAVMRADRKLDEFRADKQRQESKLRKKR